jgi:dienelactone hydrolase
LTRCVAVHDEEAVDAVEFRSRKEGAVQVQKKLSSEKLHRRRSSEEAPLASVDPLLEILARARRGIHDESVRVLGSAGGATTATLACRQDGAAAVVCLGSERVQGEVTRDLGFRWRLRR